MARFIIMSNPSNLKLKQFIDDGYREINWHGGSFPNNANPCTGNQVYIIINDNTDNAHLHYIAEIIDTNISCDSIQKLQLFNDYNYLSKSVREKREEEINNGSPEIYHKLKIRKEIIDSSINKQKLFDIGMPHTIKNGFNNRGTNDASGEHKEFFDKLEQLVQLENIKDLDSNKIKDMVDKFLKENKQIILTGAPGTGKTYNVLEYVKKNIQSRDQYEFVQFHTSYDYTDFVEGLRPVEMNGNISFVRLDGTFKAFCRRIVETNLEKAFPYLNDKKEKNDKMHDIIEKINNSKFDEQNNENEAIKTFIEGTEKYYFIIDEINRADLSKVFGELMFGLEESYRGIENRFKTQYSNLKMHEIDSSTGYAKLMEFDCFESGFFIPKNLYIIGTMNDIDRSVEAFDFALRRRFKWLDVKANDMLEEGLSDLLHDNSNDPSFKSLVKKIKKMNEIISDTQHGGKFGLTESYHIGHAYFKNLKKNTSGNYDESLKEIFETNITSILREYLRGRNQDSINELIGECREALQ